VNLSNIRVKISTNKSGRDSIIEILLKVALNTVALPLWVEIALLKESRCLLTELWIMVVCSIQKWCEKMYTCLI